VPEICLVAVGGPSGCGKTALIDRLIGSHPRIYQRPISFTSREKRQGEEECEYTFVSREEMGNRYAAGDLVNLDSVYGNLYGMSKTSLGSAAVQGRIFIKEIHPANHDKLREAGILLVRVLLIVPTWLTARQNGRGAMRSVEDMMYYRELDPTNFDIVLPLSTSDDLELVAEWFHTAIQAAIATKQMNESDIIAINRLGYEAISPQFSDSQRVTTRDFHRLSYRFFEDAINRYVADDKEVLEVGSGSGWLRTTFPWPDGRYTSTDLAFSMLQGDAHGIRRIVASADHLPFRSLTFDIVFGSLIDPFCYPTALCELRRVLRRDGLMVVTAPSADWSSRLRAPHQRYRTSFEMVDGKSVTVGSFTYSKEELRNLIVNSGFEIVELTELLSTDIPTLSEASPAILKTLGSSSVAIMNTCIAKPRIRWEPAMYV
jgi:guanylate kinase/ubiquinone/menaquinone biosynthesis C-methylase UbiE